MTKMNSSGVVNKGFQTQFAIDEGNTVHCADVREIAPNIYNVQCKPQVDEAHAVIVMRRCGYKPVPLSKVIASVGVDAFVGSPKEILVVNDPVFSVDWTRVQTTDPKIDPEFSTSFKLIIDAIASILRRSKIEILNGKIWEVAGVIMHELTRQHFLVPESCIADARDWTVSRDGTSSAKFTSMIKLVQKMFSENRGDVMCCGVHDLAFRILIGLSNCEDGLVPHSASRVERQTYIDVN